MDDPAPPSIRLARNAPGLAQHDAEPQIDVVRMRAWRLGRIQEQLKRLHLGGIVLYDPVNIRYATGSSNMQLWFTHNPIRYCWVPAEGKAVLFDYDKSMHLYHHLETVAEVRPAIGYIYMTASERIEERVAQWAADIDEVMRASHAGRQIAADRLDFEGANALQAMGYTLASGTRVTELARAVKSADEIAAMSVAISVCEAGMAKMYERLRPGISEIELWSHLHSVNIEQGGEWIETRLLTSGGRTNPWFREASSRLIRAGELVAFDTDLVGPFGYCADISRTWFCGPGKPSAEQKRLYAYACEQVEHNIALLRPGMSFFEAAEKSWPVPDEFHARRYGIAAHGVGLVDEYPTISFSDTAHRSSTGVLEAGMTLCVESYIGAEDGNEGVKLEEQVLIAENGAQRLSTFPWEEALLA